LFDAAFEKRNSMTPHRDITDEEWQRVMRLLPELLSRSEMRGRPLANTRSVLNGVLWVIYSGAAWSTMPRRYSSYQTCHRRFKRWYDEGVLKNVMVELFDEQSAKLYGAIEARIRKNAIDSEKTTLRRDVDSHMPQITVQTLNSHGSAAVVTQLPVGVSTHGIAA
jgi:transposase